MTILRRYVELDGRRISCLTAGDPSSATTLLLIHGSGVSAGYWVNQLLGLRDAFRVMAIDLPGHGKSDPIPNASVETYADTVGKFLTNVIARPVIVVGHSLGGAVAMALAAKRRDVVRGLVLLASCAKLPKVESPGERLLAFLPGPLRRILFFSMAQKLLFAPGVPMGAVSIGMQELRSCPPETILTDVQAARAMDLSEQATAIDAPTLVLCGSRDRLTPPELSEQLRALIPRARLGILEGAGHMLLLEVPERVNEAIRDFATTLTVEIRSSVLARQLRGVSLIRRLLDWTWSKPPKTTGGSLKALARHE